MLAAARQAGSSAASCPDIAASSSAIAETASGWTVTGLDIGPPGVG
jgi:hypothetical protein